MDGVLSLPAMSVNTNPETTSALPRPQGSLSSKVLADRFQAKKVVCLPVTSSFGLKVVYMSKVQTHQFNGLKKVC